MRQQCKFLWFALTCEEALAVYTVVAFLLYLAIILSGCATRYQPPGGGLYVAVKHVEQQRGKP